MRRMADRIRKAVHNLRPDELAAVRRAHAEIQGLRDNRGYATAAGFHGVPNWWCWHHLQRERSGSARLALFLPWHRAYLYDFEMRLRDRVGDATLPWWDWTKTPGIPAAYDDPQTPEGDPNPLASAFIDMPRANPPARHWTRRDPGGPGELPTQIDVEDVLATSDFLELTQRLESLHDIVHGWVGGDMGIVAYAAYDPIFWAHHCMIDRVWRMWQSQNSIARIPPGMLDEVLEPFRFTVRDVLDVHDLGYEYAASAATVTMTDIASPTASRPTASRPTASAPGA